MKRIGLPVAALETIVLLAYSAAPGRPKLQCAGIRGSCTSKRNTRFHRSGPGGGLRGQFRPRARTLQLSAALTAAAGSTPVLPAA
jgi:hypothetical protein